MAVPQFLYITLSPPTQEIILQRLLYEVSYQYKESKIAQTGIGKKEKSAEISVMVMVCSNESMHLYSILTKVVLLLLLKPILLADQNGNMP